MHGLASWGISEADCHPLARYLPFLESQAQALGPCAHGGTANRNPRPGLWTEFTWGGLMFYLLQA